MLDELYNEYLDEWYRLFTRDETVGEHMLQGMTLALGFMGTRLAQPPVDGYTDFDEIECFIDDMSTELYSCYENLLSGRDDRLSGMIQELEKIIGIAKAIYKKHGGIDTDV